jgi:predicted AAA+ superfamily ATPase
MNNNHAYSEWIYKKRWLGPEVKNAVMAFPIVIITGARQVGKSTFLQHEFPDFKYISLDDYPSLKQAETDPSSLWIDAQRIIIDEAQKSPKILNAIKLSVDKVQRKMKFILSGSSNLLLMKRISETLAGRAVYFEMLPMTYGEMQGEEDPANFISLWNPDCTIKESTLDSSDAIPLLLKGFMPPLLNLSEQKDILLWWEGYIRTYLERDLRELSQIDSLIDFRKMLESLALRTGNILNQTDIARDTGISQPTVFRYIKLLEVSNIIQRIPSYHANRIKRIIKSPKIFFIDPGLSIYLSGYYDEFSLRKARELGNYFETLLFFHLKILSELMIPKAKMYYWRTVDGKEVDFIIEHGKKILAFEVKHIKNPTINDAKNLLIFLDLYPATSKGILIYDGNSIKWIHSKILAIPWHWLAE